MNDARRAFDLLPRLELAHLPTPLEELTALSGHLGGPRILIKRDDQTGLALGGNKTRKLEFLLADALRQGASVIVTAGAAQSNHCRQTAAAAARAGIPCELVLGGELPEQPGGNLLLDFLLGATVHWTDMDRRGERMEEIAAAVRRRGGRPYLIPYGGSNGVGAAAYALAMVELGEQLKQSGRHPDTIVVASSSGGTQAGMVLGARMAGIRARIIGISIDKGERDPEPFEVQLAGIAAEAADLLGVRERFEAEDFVVEYGFLGGGYGVVGDLEREAIVLLARKEGILLDPVYTGRAMGAFLAMVRNGDPGPDDTVVFWHTGGAPALFAYASDLGLAPAGSR